MAGNYNFKVIIVGGSISGLSLANILERAGIDYLLLEGYDKIAPNAGGSIAVFPQACRIFDQLGLLDSLALRYSPVQAVNNRKPNGDAFFVTDLPTRLIARFGYPMAVMHRQDILDVLYEPLKNTEKILTRKSVSTIDNVGDVMKVTTTDGSEYWADLVVGADGIHSATRREMWRNADALQPGLITEKEKTAMFSEYACIFGISRLTPGLMAGENNLTYHNGYNIVVFEDRGKVFWTASMKVKKTHAPNIPRYSKEDMVRYAEKLATSPATNNVFFRDIWERRTSCTMVALEENVFEHWHFGRFVCIGDSIHKMTPEMGQGANAAIESAATLANNLVNLLQSLPRGKKPTMSCLNGALKGFQDTRYSRCQSLCKSSGFATRLQCGDGIGNHILGRYIMPYLGPIALNMISDSIMQSSKIDFLEEPERSGPMWPGKAKKEHSAKIGQSMVLRGILLLLVIVLGVRTFLLPMPIPLKITSIF